MDHFFNVKTLDQVMENLSAFPCVGTEVVSVTDATSRILAEDITASLDIPGFRRATMDGYAVVSKSTFGATESNPAWLEIAGQVNMGETPAFSLKSGFAAKISTGGMLPEGADSVVMIEHTETIDENSVEIYKSVAPFQHVIDSSEDFAKDDIVLKKGLTIRPPEAGLAAALGYSEIKVYKRPQVGIISTGDEVIPVTENPAPGQIRDINSYTLAGFVKEAGCVPHLYGIIKDDLDALFETCQKAFKECDMVLISGGSSVGARDFTIDVLNKIENSEILAHGISISPGKPTIFAKAGNKLLWGLPGQVVSAMVVFKIVVLPFLNQLKGCKRVFDNKLMVSAKLSRNVASTQGRQDFVRIRLTKKHNVLYAEPVLGKSGLIKTMVLADGLLEIGENVEGMEKDSIVNIIPL
ncbi:MAG: molybdopterin molybdotransferase MoeA [Desulfobacteraceae bacterium]|nr:molybdopterin molybdotransferase MoeA [Desulfobacteraceae bacterium]